MNASSNFAAVTFFTVFKVCRHRVNSVLVSLFYQFNQCTALWICTFCFDQIWFQIQEEHSAHTHLEGRSNKFSGNLKISLQLHCDPKVSVHFILRNLYMSTKFPEKMQIEVRIASSEPRNINSTVFDVKNYHEHNFSFI